MPKYMNKPALTTGQEQEIYPLLDAALKLPYGKAVIYQCSKQRANYLSHILNGERYRNAIQSISAYLPSEQFYGRGLYYNLVIEARSKGILIGHLEDPPPTITWKIIECASTRNSVDVSEYPPLRVLSRLAKLKIRHPDEIGAVYLDKDTGMLCYSIPKPEELVIVDIDIGKHIVPPPSPQDRAKVRQ